MLTYGDGAGNVDLKGLLAEHRALGASREDAMVRLTLIKIKIWWWDFVKKRGGTAIGLMRGL
ncbi:hypothetical protein [Desulfitobacterium hafniense]|uniref:hypothetical protein n=1 Tax=Desulfitobacterium hafniense TaxID=49338 RepID=UPI00031FAA12|nr:hypothetical protein [Desulfitobacterium hafniense]